MTVASGNLNTPALQKLTSPHSSWYWDFDVFMQSARYFAQYETNLDFLGCFHKTPKNQISRKSVKWKPC